MEKEIEYAERLIARYTEYAHSNWDEYRGFDMENLKINSINCAIIDVENTIEAMSQMKLIFSDRELILKYYKNVLQILKDKL